MTVTASLYNHTANKVQSGVFVAGSTYKLMLLDASGTFAAADTVVGNVSANEVSGNGWAAGGETLAGVSIDLVTTNDSVFDADNVSVTASGGAIGPAENAVIVCTTDTSSLVAHIAFGQAESAGDDTDFKINWAAGGIIVITNT